MFTSSRTFLPPLLFFQQQHLRISTYSAFCSISFGKSEDAIIVNNFGTILKDLQEIDDSIIVLQYALNIEGNSPMVLTNLGTHTLINTNRSSRSAFKSTEIDNQFGSAYEGMAVVYIQRNEGQKP